MAVQGTASPRRREEGAEKKMLRSAPVPDDRFAALYGLLPDWSVLDEALHRNLSAHGDFCRWQKALHRLPPSPSPTLRLSAGDVVALDGELPLGGEALMREALQALHPWRKGPFALFGVQVDSEWRSDMKWRRLAPFVDLAGRRVLDVGCGNGYFGWRMLAAGAELVVGIDSSALFHMQHQAVNHFARSRRNWVLPLRFGDLPAKLAAARFDAAFSMGVIYHQRDPRQHLERLRSCLKAGGQAVVESLVVDGVETLHPPGRYARMGNVWAVPTPDALVEWMAAAGFGEIRIVDLSTTTAAEQRSTAWMRFQSLADALDPANPSLTIEGHPAPQRCVVTARNLI